MVGYGSYRMLGSITFFLVLLILDFDFVTPTAIREVAVVDIFADK